MLGHSTREPEEVFAGLYPPVPTVAVLRIGWLEYFSTLNSSRSTPTHSRGNKSMMLCAILQRRR